MSNEIFKKHPNLEEAFITSNGEVFYQKGDAEIEAKKLSDKKIDHVINPSKKVAVSEPFVQVAENKAGSPKLEYTAEITKAEIKQMTVEAAVQFALETDRDKTKELVDAAFKTEELLPEENTAELTLENLSATPEEIAAKMENSNPDTVQSQVNDAIQKGVEAGTEIKLTGKQQVQKDYTDKFGEIPAEQFTTKQLFSAIASGEKLIAELNND